MGVRCTVKEAKRFGSWRKEDYISLMVDAHMI